MDDEYASGRYGYCPHENQSKMKCPNCGCGIFREDPQCKVVGAPVWCFEFVCTGCGYMIGIEVEDRSGK